MTPSQRAAEKCQEEFVNLNYDKDYAPVLVVPGTTKLRALIDTAFAPYLAKVEELREAAKEYQESVSEWLSAHESYSVIRHREITAKIKSQQLPDEFYSSRDNAEQSADKAAQRATIAGHRLRAALAALENDAE